MSDEEVVQAAMSIILHAGNARTSCKEALDAVADFNFELAESKMKEANDKIVLAHQVQTDAISAETRGEKREYSLLFAHAQDTLMTIYSELNLAKQMIKIAKHYDERMTKIEKDNI